MQMHDATPEPRTIEILGRIKGVFAAKGFDGASMQDLARAAGMSAGNFYRYFPSKNAIVEGMVSHDLMQVEGQFAEIMNAPDLVEAFRRGIRHHIETIPDDEGPLWAEIEAAAARRPEIAEISGRMQGQVLRHLVEVFARIAGVTVDEAQQRFGSHASLVFLLIKGVTIQSCGCQPALDPAGGRAMTELVLRHVDHILNEIAAAAARRPNEPVVSA